MSAPENIVYEDLHPPVTSQTSSQLLEQVWQYINEIEKQGNLAALQSLLAKNKGKINLNEAYLNKENLTPLQYAAKEGLDELAKALLLNGADINAQGSEKTTPLHLAVIHRKINLVEILLNNKGSVILQDRIGLTSFEYIFVDFNNEMEITTGLLKTTKVNKHQDTINQIAIRFYTNFIKNKIDFPTIKDIPNELKHIASFGEKTRILTIIDNFGDHSEILNGISKSIKSSNYYQHYYWLGNLYYFYGHFYPHYDNAEYKRDGIENYKQFIKFLNEKDFENDNTLEIFNSFREGKNIHFIDDFKDMAPRFINDFIKKTIVFTKWETYEKINCPALWLKLAKKSPAFKEIAKEDIDFPYSCYLKAIDSIKLDENKKIKDCSSNVEAFESSFLFYASYLKTLNKNIASLEKNKKFFQLFSKYRQVLPQDIQEKVCAILGKNAEYFPATNYYLAQIYYEDYNKSTIGTNKGKFLSCLKVIPDKHPLKNYLYSKLLISSSSKKVEILNLIATMLPLWQNAHDIYHDEIREAVIFIRDKIISEYKKDKEHVVKQQAEALELQLNSLALTASIAEYTAPVPPITLGQNPETTMNSIWDCIDKPEELVIYFQYHKQMGNVINLNDSRESLTPLQYAAKQGHNEIVEILLENGANINFGDIPPLHWAAITRQLNVITTLLRDTKIDLAKQDIHEFYALDYLFIDLTNEKTLTSNNKNQKLIHSIIELFFEIYLIRFIDLPYRFDPTRQLPSHIKGKWRDKGQFFPNALSPDSNFLWEPVFNSLCFHYQHFYWLGSFYRDQGYNLRSRSWFEKFTATLIEQDFYDEKVLAIFQALKQTIYHGESPIDDYIQKPHIFVRKTFEKLNCAYLWDCLTEVAHIRKDPDALYELYLLTIKALDFNKDGIIKASTLNLSAASAAFIKAIELLNKLNPSSKFKEKEFIKLIKLFAQYRGGLLDDHEKNILEKFSHSAKNVNSLYYYISKIYLLKMDNTNAISKLSLNAKLLEHSKQIPNNHPLKNYIESKMVKDAADKDLKIIKLFEAMLLQWKETDDAYKEEIDAAKPDVIKQLQNYKNNPNPTISTSANTMLASLSAMSSNEASAPPAELELSNTIINQNSYNIVTNSLSSTTISNSTQVNTTIQNFDALFPKANNNTSNKTNNFTSFIKPSPFINSSEKIEKMAQEIAEEEQALERRKEELKKKKMQLKVQQELSQPSDGVAEQRAKTDLLKRFYELAGEESTRADSSNLKNPYSP